MTLPKTKHRKSFRLSDEAVALLRKLSSERGVTETAIVEQAVRAYAKKRT